MTSATGDTTSYTSTLYSWEFQRFNHGLWSRQTYAGEHHDPRGTERSEYTAEAFARQVLTQHAPCDSEPWQLVVRAESGVGRPLVYAITSDQAFT